MFLKSELFRALTFPKSVSLPFSYYLLVCLRFLLTLMPQTGYIHPDEYFQNVEVIAGDIFTIDVSRTWEFNPAFPVRNILIPKLILGPPLHFIRIFNPYSKYYLNIDLKTPYYLLIIPRVFICFLSLLNDYCLYRICYIYGQNYRNRLKIFASSYVVLVYCCRSFSNSFEMIFFSILLLLVAECMALSDKVIYHDEFLREKYKKARTAVEKVKIFKLQNHLPSHMLNRVMIISSIVVIGIFNRPTFVGFAFPPMFFWLHRGLGSQVVGLKDFHIRILTLVVCGIPALCLLVLVDSAYYGYLTIADVESMKVSWDNWVVTPLNFIRYNSDMKNLMKHGLHPRWLHLFVNTPLLFNVLGAMGFTTFITNTYRFLRGQYSKLPRIQSITGLMLFSLIIPITVLSAFPHQEARFIIPIIVPLVYLYGNNFYSNESDGPKVQYLKKVLLLAWFGLNILFTLFFGFIHQGGIFKFTNNLHYEIKEAYNMHTHVITTHSYSIPTYLLQLESTTKVWTDRNTGHKYRLTKNTFITKYGSLPTEGLMQNIDYVLNKAEEFLHTNKKKYKFYVASPCSLDEKIKRASKRYSYFRLVDEFTYYPHFSTEALPIFPDRYDKYCLDNYLINNKNESQVLDLNFMQRISCYLKQFCFKVYSVKNVVNLI